MWINPTEKPFTVLLLAPDLTASDFGHYAHLAHVSAREVAEAIDLARKDVQAEYLGEDDCHKTLDWHVLVVCEGHIEDIKDQALAKETSRDILAKLHASQKGRCRA